MLQSHDWDCSDHDLVMAKELQEPVSQHDLGSDANWEVIHADMRKGEYEAVFCGTPCETASKARDGPPGPRPLRSPEHIYGLPRSELTEAEAEQVRLGTYFALKTAETSHRMNTAGVSYPLVTARENGTLSAHKLVASVVETR